MDVSGEHQLDVDLNIYRQRINAKGEPIDDKVQPVKLGEEDPDAAKELIKVTFIPLFNLSMSALGFVAGVVC